MASASRDKFSRDDEPELGDIDANVLDDPSPSPASGSTRASRKTIKRSKAGSSGDDSDDASDAANNTPSDASTVASNKVDTSVARTSAATTVAPGTMAPADASVAPQARPAHTFGWTRMVFWPLVLAFVALQYRLWIGEGSFAEVWRLTLEIEKQEQENHVLGERNRRLSAEVRDLREGGAAVEERARKQLGMVKDDETLYILHPKSP